MFNGLRGYPQVVPAGTVRTTGLFDRSRQHPKGRSGLLGDLEIRSSLHVAQVCGSHRAFRRIGAPMCLSHHPASPLTEDEVIARAARRVPGSSS